MADNRQGNVPGAQPNLAEYKKSQARVRELLEKRRLLEKRLGQVEDGIAQKETAYLDSTPSGNVITGFDNYMKGTTGSAAQRRKMGFMEQNRVFSKSSISYRPSNGDSSAPGSAGQTPASHVPTPIVTNIRDSGSSHATPTSATGNKSSNKNKKKESEDSEGDSQTNKKRTNFGATRK